MIASGRVAYLARRGPKDYGVNINGNGENGEKRGNVDMRIVRERKRAIVDSFRGGSERRVEGAGVKVLNGRAEFVGEKVVKVFLNDGGEEEVTSELVFINTGERPSRPALQGIETLDKKVVLDSTSVMELDEVPRHLVVIGGGYIALEFGQLFRRLGAEVTIIQRGARLAPRADPEISEELKKILEEDGIHIHLQSSGTKVSSEGSELTIEMQKKGSDTTESIQGTHILCAVGRTPNTDSLNLPAAGIKTDATGHIVTNTKLETSVPGIYALGDVKGGPAFTHVSYDDFRIIRDTLIQPATSSPSNSQEQQQPKKTSYEDRYKTLPYVVFTDPQLGHVGLTHAEALSKYPSRHIQTAKMPMSYVARALEMDETRGMMKAVVDGDSGEILGFTCLGIEGGELMNVVQMAMMGGVKWWDLREAVFAHPTIGESLNNLWGFLED